MAKKDSKDTDGFRKKTHESFDKIMDKAENMSESGKQTMADIKDRGTKMRVDFDDYVQRNPKQSMLIVAGAVMVACAVTKMTLTRKKCKCSSD